VIRHDLEKEKMFRDLFIVQINRDFFLHKKCFSTEIFSTLYVYIKAHLQLLVELFD
jgi:hypothetical protein